LLSYISTWVILVPELHQCLNTTTEEMRITTTAQLQLEVIKEKIAQQKISLLVDVILLASKNCYMSDESHDQNGVSTFVFLYKDDSELRVDIEGAVYCNNDYEDAYNIFE